MQPSQTADPTRLIYATGQGSFIGCHAVISLTLDSVFIPQVRALTLQSKFTVALFSFSL